MVTRDLNCIKKNIFLFQTRAKHLERRDPEVLLDHVMVADPGRGAERGETVGVRAKNVKARRVGPKGEGTKGRRGSKVELQVEQMKRAML